MKKKFTGNRLVYVELIKNTGLYYPEGCLKCTVWDGQCTEAETENRPQHWGYIHK